MYCSHPVGCINRLRRKKLHNYKLMNKVDKTENATEMTGLLRFFFPLLLSIVCLFVFVLVLVFLFLFLVSFFLFSSLLFLSDTL